MVDRMAQGSGMVGRVAWGSGMENILGTMVQPPHTPGIERA